MEINIKQKVMNKGNLIDKAVGRHSRDGHPVAVTYSRHTVGINRVEFLGSSGKEARIIIQVMDPLHSTYQILSKSDFDHGTVRVAIPDSNHKEVKIRIFIALFFVGFLFSLYAFDNAHVDFYSKISEHKGIKKMIEKVDDWEVISFFDREGYLLHQTNTYQNEIRSDLRFSYTVTDTLAEIRSLDAIDLNRDGDTLRIYQYYYDSSGQCYQYRVYFSDWDNSSDWDNPSNFIFRDNFVYEAGMLVSYSEDDIEEHIYKYNEKKQKERRLEISSEADTTFYTYVYNQHGKLTDFIKESHDIEVFFGDAPFWNKTRGNKIHIRYTDFDRHGNWTRSYFITEKDTIINEEREIEYW